jgi:hypothetical protein
VKSAKSQPYRPPRPVIGRGFLFLRNQYRKPTVTKKYALKLYSVFSNAHKIILISVQLSQRNTENEER